MKLPSLTANHRTIRIVGVLLGLYLAMLVGVAYVGQAHLRDALLEQERLSTEKRAAAIDHLLAGQETLLGGLANGSAVHNYLTNRAAGMSEARGLRASLAAVSRTFHEVMQRPQQAQAAALERLLLVDLSGHPLLEVDGNGEVPHDRYVLHDTQQLGSMAVKRGTDGLSVLLTVPVVHEERRAGYIVGAVDKSRLLATLLADSGHIETYHQHATALVDAEGGLIVSNVGADWPDWQARTGRFGDTVVEQSLAADRLRVVTIADLDGMQTLLTSPLFLAALALVSLPLLIGVSHLLRLSNYNLVLQTRFATTRQQRGLLRKQNERLQREIDKRFESEKKLVHQANYDQLTGLPNRSLALDRLAQAVKWARREGGSVQVLFLDLDRFKQVNDSLGHSAGDELLREAAQRLRAKMRDSDTVSRLGGDEFLVICPDPPGAGDWEQVARDLLKTLSQPFYIGDHEFFVGASIGVASFPEGGTEPQRLLKNADIAMYAAKEQGRNRYSYYDPSLDAAAVESMKIENNLRHALAREELHLLFQPIVDLSSGSIVAAEALLRWTNRELGDVPPDKFIPVAEETGLIHEIGEWVLTEACRQIGTLHTDREFRVAVNLSTRQFSRPGRLLDCVLSALRTSGLMPSQLELEITESVLIDDRPEIGALIGQLDRIGVRLSIDDFGTGYSALNYLQRFPFDILKIDRSFTQEIPDNEASSSLIRAIIAMAHALGLEVIAEGIEHRTQAGFLLVQHCEFGQGFLYSRPVSLHNLHELLAEEHAKSA